MDDTINSAATVDLAPDGSAWFADRIKAVEDQRAADVAEIHELRAEVGRLRKSPCDSRNETQAAFCKVDAMKDAVLATARAELKQTATVAHVLKRSVGGLSRTIKRLRGEDPDRC